MADPYNAKDVILEYIRNNEGLDVYLDDVEFSNPVKSPTSPIPLRNTSVTITPTTTSGFYGKKIFHYNRIHISELGTITVEKGSATNHEQLLPAINLKYGLYLVPDDIINQPISPMLTGEIEVDLVINPNSLTWYDGPIIETSE